MKEMGMKATPLTEWQGTDAMGTKFELCATHFLLLRTNFAHNSHIGHNLLAHFRVNFEYLVVTAFSS